MRNLLPAFFLLMSMLPGESFAAACPASSSTIAAGDAFTCDVTNNDTGTVVTLNFNSGFGSTTLIESDTAALLATDAYLSSISGKTVSEASAMAITAATASIASGNNGTTVGAQRKLSFIKTAEIIASQIESTVPIVIDADFSRLGCGSDDATLGSAGASNNLAHNDPAPSGFLSNTLYPIGLFNAISGLDNDPGLSDVSASFNSDTGLGDCLRGSNGWYYGFNPPPSAVYTAQNGDPLNLVDLNGTPITLVTTYIGFTTVLLHEIMHGLGFASAVSAATGVEGFGTGKDDIYSNNIYDNTTSRNWNDPNETNANRQASAKSGTDLLWTGAHVNTQAIGVLTAGYQDNDGDPAFTSGDYIQMYAPNPLEDGSSLSHFNTAASPNELMEPEYTEGTLSLGLALYLLQDIGWSINPPAPNNAPVITQPNNQAIELGQTLNIALIANDADGDPLSYFVTAASSAGAIIVNTSSISFTPTALGDYAITVTVSDSKVSESSVFTLTVYDTPTLELGDSTFLPNNGSESLITDNDVVFDSSNVSSIFDFDLNFNGSDVSSSLMAINGTSLTITIPASGPFAGTYTLTATDSISGNEYTYTFIRSPRLNLSATKILENTNVQSLTIEGGAANTVYTLTSSESALSFRLNDTEVTNASATDDPESFNPITLILAAGTVLSSTSAELSVGSIYQTVSTSGLSIEPARTHIVTIQEENGSAIGQAELSLNILDLTAYHLVENYSSNSAGQITIILPDDGNDYDVVARYTGLESVTATLTPSLLDQIITLSPAINSVNLIGSITAAGSLSFGADLPVVTLFLMDDSTVNIPVTVISNSLATFDYTHQLNTGDIKSIEITQSGAVSITQNILNQDTLNFDFAMEARSTTTVVVPSTGSAGSVYWLLLVLLIISRFSRKQLSRCKNLPSKYMK